MSRIFISYSSLNEAEAIEIKDWIETNGWDGEVLLDLDPERGLVAGKKSASADYTIKLWEVATGKERETLTGHTASVFSVSYSPDGNTLASASADKPIKLWDTKIEE